MFAGVRRSPVPAETYETRRLPVVVRRSNSECFFFMYVVRYERTRL